MMSYQDQHKMYWIMQINSVNSRLMVRWQQIACCGKHRQLTT